MFQLNNNISKGRCHQTIMSNRTVKQGAKPERDKNIYLLTAGKIFIKAYIVFIRNAFAQESFDLCRWGSRLYIVIYLLKMRVEIFHPFFYFLANDGIETYVPYFVL